MWLHIGLGRALRVGRAVLILIAVAHNEVDNRGDFVQLAATRGDAEDTGGFNLLTENRITGKQCASLEDALFDFRI